MGRNTLSAKELYDIECALDFYVSEDMEYMRSDEIKRLYDLKEKIRKLRIKDLTNTPK